MPRARESPLLALGSSIELGIWAARHPPSTGQVASQGTRHPSLTPLPRRLQARVARAAVQNCTSWCSSRPHHHQSRATGARVCVCVVAALAEGDEQQSVTRPEGIGIGPAHATSQHKDTNHRRRASVHGSGATLQVGRLPSKGPFEYPLDGSSPIRYRASPRQVLREQTRAKKGKT